MAYLILHQDEMRVRSFVLNRDVTTIGRSSVNDISVPDRFVSREHAKIIRLEDGSFEIQDLGAKHPIRINEKVVAKHRLDEGDRIQVGNSLLIYQSEEACPSGKVEFLSPDEMSQVSVEVTSVDAKKTQPFSLLDLDSKDFLSLQRDHQRLMLLYEFSKSVNSHLEEPHNLLDEIMNTAFKTLDAERGFVALLDPKTRELSCELIRDESLGQAGEDLEVSKTIFHRVLDERISILTVNALKDSQFEQAKSVRQFNIRSAICAPLMFREKVLGVVYLDNRASAGRFSEDDLMFLMAMCHLAGIAMGNADLHRQVLKENVRLADALRPKFQIIGESDEMKRIFQTMKKVAPSDITILLQGETGTGKELIARALHALSPRSEKPFVAVNCAAIPKELIESELFGHEKGAFTGATNSREGKFQQAHGGTIFLDEVGDMSLDTQAKVLRVLEERELQRVGGGQTFRVDVRVIAATNKDLLRGVEKADFREDLYYRLNVVPITIPPLRERKGDIINLAEHFMAGRAKKISRSARKLLTAYAWPGNVRELKNTIERAIVLGDGEVIQPEDLPHGLRLGGKMIAEPLESLEHMEEDHILRVLRHTGWNKSETAKILGVTRQTLDNKINKYSLQKEG
jgi:transcriptional regulator with GAF, ATPase, and Fis domain